MKKLGIILCIIALFVSGCSNRKTQVDDGLILRQSMLSGEGCRFSASITADYADRIYVFKMDCTAQPSGTVGFTVMEPETISGISGEIAQEGGKLKFDDQALLFEPMVQGQLTPVIAPWLMVKAIQSGYIRSVSVKNDERELIIDDTFGNEAFQIVLLLDMDSTPEFCEIYHNQRRILSIKVENFKKV